LKKTAFALKKTPLLLIFLIVFISNHTHGQDNNVALFFFTTDYKLDQEKEFLEFQTNMAKEEVMYTYGFRASAYQNYNKVNFFNSISNECSADSTSSTKQLLVYISGLSAVDDEGNVYLQISEADSLAFDEMISLKEVSNSLSNCAAQHVLLFMDVPHSDTISKHTEKENDDLFPSDSLAREVIIDRSFKLKSSFYVGSSDDKVATVGRSRFSPMTSKFLEILRNYGDGDDVVTMDEFKSYMDALEATPKMGAFSNSEEKSDFLFIVK